MTGHNPKDATMGVNVPSLVIFDCDGVLVDSEPITNRELADDLTAHGLPLTQSECIELFVGGTMSGVRERAINMGARLPEDWVQRFYDRMVSALANEVEVIDGVEDVLDCLDQRQLPYCVASNGPMRKMETTLGRTGLWDRMAGRVFSAHDIGKAKPDPGLFLHAAEVLGAAPARCIVIEDSASGARAARAAGMRCFGYSAATPQAKLTHEGAIPFDTMRALPELLGIGRAFASNAMGDPRGTS